jgi:hypothetical protein
MLICMMPIALIIHYSNAFKKRSDVPANIISADSHRFDGQNEADSKLENDSDEKANTRNRERSLVEDRESIASDVAKDMLIPEGKVSYEQLIKYPGYIDKTNLILKFFDYFQICTCILSPRRSGKTTAVQMLKSFFQVPQIDVNTYNPDEKTFNPLKKTFKQILDENSPEGRKFCKFD